MEFIKEIKIKNFKSLKNIRLRLRRVNVIIGEPNTGKTNLVEFFRLVFYLGKNEIGRFQDLLRFEEPAELFYLFDMETPIESSIISTAGSRLGFEFSCDLSRERLQWQGFEILEDQEQLAGFEIFGDEEIPLFSGEARFDFSGTSSHGDKFEKSLFNRIHPYEFKGLKDVSFSSKYVYLAPPTGRNMFRVLLNNKKLKNYIDNLLNEFSFELVFRMQNRELEFQQKFEDLKLSFPLNSLPDTLQAMIFYSAIIKSNEGSVIILDEPERTMFPVFSKRLSEMFARDTRNQYIIVTHNPYFLQTLIEKTPRREIALFVAKRIENSFETTFSSVDVQKIMNELDTDPFFNLNKYL